MSAVLSRVLNLLLQAWPWFPDALTLFNSIAREDGAPGEHELLACPTPEGLAKLTATSPASLLPLQQEHP